jgi:drug/metabolite transporter (DMT)-like permease
VVTVGAILGFNLIALKVAIRASDPITVQALSTVIGVVAMLSLARTVGAPLQLPPRNLMAALAVGLAMTVGSALGVAFGVQRVSAGLAALLLSATPIMALILDYLITRQRHSWHGPAGVLLGFAGVAVVASDSGHSQLLGVAFMLAGAFGWSLGLVLMKRMGPLAPPTTFIAWQMLLGTPVLLMIGYLVTGLQASWSLLFVAALAYAGAGAKAISFLLQLLVLRLGTALHASLTAFVMPVFASAAGALLLGERIQAVEVAGAVAILTGVALVIRSRPGGEAKPAVPST